MRAHWEVVSLVIAVVSFVVRAAGLRSVTGLLVTQPFRLSTEEKVQRGGFVPSTPLRQFYS